MHLTNSSRAAGEWHGLNPHVPAAEYLFLCTYPILITLAHLWYFNTCSSLVFLTKRFKPAADILSATDSDTLEIGIDIKLHIIQLN